MNSKSHHYYCPKCGDITLTKEEDKKCRFCGEKYIQTKYTFSVDDLFNDDIDVDKQIFEEYIKDNPLFDEDLYAQRVGKEKLMQEATSDRLKEQNKPQCPICQSTNLSKITTTKKAGKIALFGIFGMGDNGKTWKCNNCGSKF